MCGQNAYCRTVNHIPTCMCNSGFYGDPFSFCNNERSKVHHHFCPCFLNMLFLDITQEVISPCSPSPCGSNAVCKEQNRAGSCTCISDYIGNPYEGCRPECTLNSDCPYNKACVRSKCKDPCPGTCGQNSQCQVVNHLPMCTCFQGYTGNPFSFCNIIQPSRYFHSAISFDTDDDFSVEDEVEQNSCQPSPCGPNSQCREINNQAVCSCLPNFFGSPPACRPECTVSSECSLDKACVNNKCIDPCIGSCGLNSNCQVINHSPICSCKIGHTGDPFTICRPIPPSKFC